MPTIDLSAHASTLGDPSRYFVSSEGRAFPIVVENATGLPRYTIDGAGALHPYEPSLLGNLTAGVSVTNPPGFAGFPDHDRDDPASRPEAHGLEPAEYFTHWDADHPTFVRHSTAMPEYQVIDGRLVPIG